MFGFCSNKLDITLFYTTKQQREIKVAYDVPYILNTKWRLRIEAAYEVNPNLLYFGTDQNTFNELKNNNTGDQFKTFDAYDASLNVARLGNIANGELTNKFYSDQFY